MASRGPLQLALTRPAELDLEAAPACPPSGGGLQWHCSRRAVRQRLGEERRLLCSWLLAHLIVSGVLMFYGGSVLFRNLANYRHRGLVYYADKVLPTQATVALQDARLLPASTGASVPLAQQLNASEFRAMAVALRHPQSNLSALRGEPFALRDIAAETLPDLSTSQIASAANEIVAGILLALVIAFCFTPLFVSFQGKARPHTVAMVLRLLRALASAHTLRMFTYLATSVPGPAGHCQSVRWTAKDGTHGNEEVGRSHTQTVSDMLFSTWTLVHNSNCGDLIFSGHTVTAMTTALLVQFYSARMLPPVAARVVISVVWAVFLFQIFFVLSTHNHYAIDTVVALYTAPFNFIAWLHFFPADPTPDDVGAGYFRPKTHGDVV